MYSIHMYTHPIITPLIPLLPASLWFGSISCLPEASVMSSLQFSHYHYKITISLCLPAILRDHQTSKIFLIQSETLNKKILTLMDSLFSEKNIPKEVCNLELSLSPLFPLFLGLYFSLFNVFVKTV